MNIVILDAFTANPGDLSWDALREFGQLTVYDRTSPDQLMERASEADVLLTNKVELRKQHLDHLPRLRYIGVLATGYNVVDTAYARHCGIVVTNVPAYSTDSVAQMVFAHLLNITHHVGDYARLNRQGRWSESPDFSYTDTPLMELSGKIMGIVGLGNIGMRVAAIARQFGMDIFAVTSKHSSTLPAGIQKTTLEGLLAASHVVSLHCPLTEQTYRMINRESLALMRLGSILLNTGRGGLVDEDAVAEALHNGRLLAYAADVLSEEPPSASHVLLQCENAYITPHIAWATREARQRLISITVDNLRAFIEGVPVHVVN